MKNCFLRLFYDEIAKCSVHSNIFVKPKQYVSCLLVLWCFSPWFCKFSCLVCSVKCLYVESIFYLVSNVFMDFQSRSQSPRSSVQGIMGLWENAEENQPLIGCLIISLTHSLLVEIRAILIIQEVKYKLVYLTRLFIASLT